MDDNIIRALINIIGEENVLTDHDTLENYGHDETPLYTSMPEVVVKPKSTKEVSKIMRIAHENNLAVTPRSGGTSLSAGAVPVHKGIILTLERMNSIKDIDEKNLMVVVEPGIITEQLGYELDKYGLFFPPDPVSLDSCMVGGNIAECAGGPRAMKYGVTKNYVLGLEIVMPNGSIQRYGGKLLKNVTGYNIIDLIIGSEGTLAIITEATLRILVKPKIIIDLLVPFRSVENAVNFALDVIRADLMPAAIELMEGAVYRIAAKYLHRTLPFTEANAHIIIELDGNNKAQLRQNYNEIGDIALRHNALDVFVAESEQDKEKIWEPRKNASDALKEHTKLLAREDLVVPKDKTAELIKQVKICVQKYDAKLYAFGHLGDGNIHADIGIDKDKTLKRADLDKMRRQVYEITIGLGGAITAEHGIGHSKIEYLAMAFDKEQIALMRSIKKVFDPKNILNPGKIFKDHD